MTKKPTYEELEQRVKDLEKGNATCREALRQSESRLQFFTDGPAVVYTCKTEGDYGTTFISENVKVQLGYEPREFIENPEFWADHIHPEDRMRVLGDLSRAFKQGHHIHEYRFQNKEGNYRWMRDELKLIRDAAGKPLEMIGYWTDITDRIRTEKALRESQELYRSLFENTGTATAIVEEDMTLSMVNTKFEQLAGWSRSEIVGRMKWTEFTAEEDKKRAIFYHFQRRKNNKKVPEKYEFRFVDRNGNLKKVWVKVGVIPNTKKSVASVTDITSLKRVESKIRDAKREWERTFDSIDEIITIVDTQMRVVRVNRAATRLLDAGFKEIIGKHCYELFHASSNPCKGCPSLNADQHKTFPSIEVNSFLLDKTFQMSVSPIFDDSKELSGFVCFAKDITEAKKLESQLRQAQKMEAIGTLAGGIAHDFNNILSAIMGFTELTMYQVPGDSPLRSNLNEICTATMRAKDLVEQILTFSRRNENEHEPLPVQVHMIVKEVLKLMRSTLPATIEIRKKIQGTKPVMADPAQIHQLLMNLCTNAYNAMSDKGGILEVGLCEVNLDASAVRLYPDLEDTGPYLKLTVSDSGCGMPPEVMARIFDPYYTTKEKGKGSGLGLAIVHAIVKRCHGAITVDSTVGGGSTFCVYLPVVEIVPKTKNSTVDSIPRGNERILFVDDEKPIAKMAKLLFERLGYQVTAQTSSLEALAVFRTQPEAFDLVITDMTMPRMTGIELIEKLKQIKPDIPVILCTGFNEQLTEGKVEAMGFSALIMKPFTQKKIAKTIRMVLDGC